MAKGFVAAGNVPPCRFVTMSTTVDHAVVVSASGDICCGISGKGVHNVPGTIGGVAVDDGYAAISGMSCPVFLQGDSEDGHDIWLELDGTVTQGDFLKPGTGNDGKGITAGATTFYGARALSSGVAGQLILVQVITGYRT